MIPIVFISDDNYAMPTAVAITSIIRNKQRTTCYEINIISNNISEKNKFKIKKLEQNNIKINLIEKETNFVDISTKNHYVTETALLKFFIAEIFPQHDKILYIDSDVIIENDLTDLYNTNISQYYAGAIQDIVCCECKVPEKFNLKNYFNSGVMLLNLKNIRENNLTQSLVETKRTINSNFQDQDAFNIVFAEHIKFLSLKYNFISTYQKYTNKQLENFYKEKISKPVIIHFAWLKPWKYSDIKYSKNFLKYYKISSFKNNKLKLEKYHKNQKLIKFIRGCYILKMIYIN